jgi:hypothetical protein
MKVPLVVLATCLAFSPPMQAQDRGQSSSRPFAGPCAVADPTYNQLANATGGQVLRLRPGEMAMAAPVLTAQLAHDEDVFYASGHLGKHGVREFEFQVDAAISSLWVSVSVECRVDISVFMPGGVGMPAHDLPPGATQVDLSNLRALTVNEPTRGRWLVRVRGGGAYAVSVRAKTPLTFDGVEFVRLGGRPGHEGYFRIEGPPTSRQQTVRATLRGPLREATFLFLAEDGEVLKRFRLQRDGQGDDHHGPVELPRQPFRAAVVGSDATGQHFQRVDPRLLRPVEGPAERVPARP